MGLFDGAIAVENDISNSGFKNVVGKCEHAFMSETFDLHLYSLMMLVDNMQ